ncbi:MAG TPA: DUF6089 family protein [Bacteroidales bacterium]|nr:DUF6089 family protein [Bacteroidales bacterium]
MRIIAAISLIFSLMTLQLRSQDIDIGIFGGGSYYLGELNPGRQFLFTNPAYGGLARFNINTRWALRGQLLQGDLAGDDAVSKADEMRNLRFNSKVTELSAIMEFNFLDYFSGSHVNYFSPYLFAGPAFFTFNPTAQYNNQTIVLRDIGTEGQLEGDADSRYDLISFALAFGFGMKYSLSNRLGLTAEWGLRKTFTDYLDDISGNYYIDFSTVSNPGSIENLSDPSPIKHEPGMQRGNSQNNDWYSFAGITLTYRFSVGEKSTCVDFLD